MTSCDATLFKERRSIPERKTNLKQQKCDSIRFCYSSLLLTEQQKKLLQSNSFIIQRAFPSLFPQRQLLSYVSWHLSHQYINQYKWSGYWHHWTKRSDFITCGTVLNIQHLCAVWTKPKCLAVYYTDRLMQFGVWEFTHIYLSLQSFILGGDSFSQYGFLDALLFL